MGDERTIQMAQASEHWMHRHERVVDHREAREVRRQDAGICTEACINESVTLKQSAQYLIRACRCQGVAQHSHVPSTTEQNVKVLEEVDSTGPVKVEQRDLQTQALQVVQVTCQHCRVLMSAIQGMAN